MHWIVPMLFCIPFGTGMILAFNSGSLYVTECYDADYLASILAGQAMARSFFAAICESRLSVTFSQWAPRAECH